MHAADALPVILVAAFVVPLLVAWRTRMIRVEARIEVPPPDPEEPAKVRRTRREMDDLPSPFAPGEVVTPDQATGTSLRPIRVVPALQLEPEREAETAPSVSTEASRVVPLAIPQESLPPRRVIPMASDEQLPTPVRRRGSGFPGAIDRAVVALPDEIPVPVRVSLARTGDDDV